MQLPLPDAFPGTVSLQRNEPMLLQQCAAMGQSQRRAVREGS